MTASETRVRELYKSRGTPLSRRSKGADFADSEGGLVEVKTGVLSPYQATEMVEAYRYGVRVRIEVVHGDGILTFELVRCATLPTADHRPTDTCVEAPLRPIRMHRDGRLRLPTRIQLQYQLRAGDRLAVEVREDGILLVPLERPKPRRFAVA